MAETPGFPAGAVYPTADGWKADRLKVQAVMDALKAERLRRGIGQEDGAGLLGLTPSDFRDFERGDTHRAAEQLAEYARYLGGELRIEFVPGPEASHG